MASILVTITLLFGETIASADDYVSLRQAGLAEYEMGHYARAEELIRKALELAETINNEYEVALSYSALGDVYQATVRFPEAERAYRKGVSILTGRPERAHATGQPQLHPGRSHSRSPPQREGRCSSAPPGKASTRAGPEPSAPRRAGSAARVTPLGSLP